MDNMTKIIKVKKSADGDITDVMLENGNVYSLLLYFFNPANLADSTAY